ncbi:DNA-binding SARP family transcriptional activator [Micromonospora sagamiensis]|uniref:DNA-binding SARP family transcriptional activator n=1 Tax=Micromonospora sagamiensis TaxID=47875 RepID=A0A562W9A4_9ACTN|nr:DNA-binding SARP family transcriptional activator [Micromonospora sagamiensis]
MLRRPATVVRFRLLGPLTITDEGRRVRLDGNRPRAVLALLLLNANSLVPVDQIIDAVWGDRPPRTVRTQVQGQISVIRRCLRGLPGVEVRTHSTGYLLRADPGGIDVAVFRHLARQGRALAATGRRDAAAEAYRSALRLHIGPPLGDVDAPFAVTEAARLAEERIGVKSELIGLDLADGRHHELIPKLTAMVERHPLHEPLWRHLVVALHRAGRRSEAVSCYRRARMLLRDELGLDPGPELSLAYQALLRAEPPVPAAPPVPAGPAPIDAGRAGAGLAETLLRLDEIERMLRDIRRHLIDGGEPAARLGSATTPPADRLNSDGAAPHPEVAA